MNHKAIVVKQLNEEAAELRDRLAKIETGIVALGGTVASTISSSQDGRRRRSKVRKPAAAPQAPRQATSTETLHPDLQAQLNAIKANSKLSPIQKAQESRKARSAFAKAAASTPARPEGAVLSEAEG